MKIEIDVDPGSLGKTLQEILTGLTPDERKDLAQRTMEAWLKEPLDIERASKEREVIETIQKERSWVREKESAEETRKGYDFKIQMGGWRSTREVMIDSITREITSHYKAEVSRIVQADPRVQAMKDEVIKIIMATFPQTVHDALVLWVAGNLQRALDGLQNVVVKAEEFQVAQKSMAERLLEVSRRVGLPGV